MGKTIFQNQYPCRPGEQARDKDYQRFQLIRYEAASPTAFGLIGGAARWAAGIYKTALMLKNALHHTAQDGVNRTLKSICAFLLVFSLDHRPVSAQKPGGFDAGQLKIRWELVENNYHKQPQFLSALTVSNTAHSALPDKGWALYFNYISEIRPQSVTGNVIIEHVNGDIFRLRPAPGF